MELYRDMRKCLFSWYSSIYSPTFGIIFWNKTCYSGNGQQASLSRSCWVFGFIEASYRGSHLTSKTSVYKKHTQTAPQRYTHSKSLAKIDILQALHLPYADKHWLWVNAAHTPWDSDTFLHLSALQCQYFEWGVSPRQTVWLWKEGVDFLLSFHAMIVQ